MRECLAPKGTAGWKKKKKKIQSSQPSGMGTSLMRVHGHINQNKSVDTWKTHIAH